MISYKSRKPGEKFDSSVFYDPEGSAPAKRGKTVHGYGSQFLADLRFGLVWRFAVFLLNTLKWHKIRHGQLRAMVLRSSTSSSFRT